MADPNLTTSGPQYLLNVARWRPEQEKKMPWMDKNGKV